MVFESQRSGFQKVKAIPARGCIDWNRCSSASRPPLLVDGFSSKKIMIKVEQIHTSCNALLFDDFRTIVSWTMEISALWNILVAKRKQYLDNLCFDNFMYSEHDCMFSIPIMIYFNYFQWNKLNMCYTIMSVIYCFIIEFWINIMWF